MNKKSAFYGSVLAIVAGGLLASASVFADVSVKNSVDINATGGSASANQSQSQSQAQRQSQLTADSSSSSQSQSQSQNQSQSQSVSATGGSASVDQSTKITIDSKKDNDKNNHDKNVRRDKNGHIIYRKLPITGTGDAGLIALVVIAAAASIYGVRKYSSKINK